MKKSLGDPSFFKQNDTIYANNKTSAKLSWKRKEAIQIAQSIHQWFQERGFNLPASRRTIFGRAFKQSDTMRTNVSTEITKSVNLRQDIKHQLDYENYVVRVKSKSIAKFPSSFINFSLDKYEQWIKTPQVKQCQLQSELPMSFDHFTSKKYLDLTLFRLI